MKRKLLISLLVLVIPLTVYAQQTMRLGGGLISISRLGAVVIKSRADKTIALQGDTTVAGTTAITGNTTVAGTMGVTGNTAAVSSTLSVGGGAAIAKVITGTGSVDFTALAAGTCENFTITVTGAANGDSVALGIPAAAWATTEYATIEGFVSATNTVTVKRCNLTNATTALSDPAAVTVRATVIQF
jgi:hypothetical protein